ncbi:MAG TPA: winged helix-turn-helix domain-containing protein [Solirubrobacterales bacterium]|nr:winged helix-turn-helix domain-containing protein [Solirubrobacterales bacterium]
MTTKPRARRRAARNHLEAMKHELRHEIWLILVQRTASPKELAEELDADLSLVSHHTKRLVALGCAELVRSRPVRGAIEHFYRATKQVLVDDSDWNRLLEEDPGLADYMLGNFMQAQLDDYRKSIEAGVLGSDDRFLIDRTPVVVDSKGCDELLEALDRFETEVVPDIVQRSAERRDGSDDEAVHMSLCLSLFKTPPPS